MSAQPQPITHMTESHMLLAVDSVVANRGRASQRVEAQEIAGYLLGDRSRERWNSLMDDVHRTMRALGELGLVEIHRLENRRLFYELTDAGRTEVAALLNSTEFQKSARSPKQATAELEARVESLRTETLSALDAVAQAVRGASSAQDLAGPDGDPRTIAGALDDQVAWLAQTLDTLAAARGDSPAP